MAGLWKFYADFYGSFMEVLCKGFWQFMAFSWLEFYGNFMLAHKNRILYGVFLEFYVIPRVFPPAILYGKFTK